MGQALLVAQAVGTVVSTIQQANAAKAQAEADANRFEFQKQQLENAQRDELIAAKQEETIQRRELNDALSTIDAIRASRGQRFSSPTSQAITRDITQSASADIRTNRLNRLSRADTLRQQSVYAGNMASYSRRVGEYSSNQAFVQGGVSLLSGAASSNVGKSFFGNAGNFGVQSGGQTGIAGIRNRLNSARGFYGPGF